MRISFLILLMNALIFTQVSSAASESTKLKGALLKAMKTHDTATVKALADGGHESIDRDDVLQERIYEYLDAERQREIKAKEKAKAAALAKQQAKEKASSDAVAAKKAAKDKVKADAVAKQNAEIKAAAAAVAAKKAAKNKKKKDALAAKNRAKADAIAKQNAEKKAAAAAVAAKKAKEDKARRAKAAEKKRKNAAAAKKKAAAQKQAKAKKTTPKKKAAPKTTVTAPKVKAAPKAVIAAPVVAAPIAAAVAAEPLTVSDKKLVGTWKQISSEKVITLVIEEDTNFSLEQVEDDGTLTITGTWKSEENIFMLSIKKVQRNVHSRETDIHRIYKVERLSKHRLVLRDKRNRIAYDLKR